MYFQKKINEMLRPNVSQQSQQNKKKIDFILALIPINKEKD